jgi:hypothetical protein
MAKKGITVSADLKRLRLAPGRVKGEVGGEVRKVALDLLSESVRRAPVDEGPLRGSGTAHFDSKRIATGKDFDQSAEGGEGAEGGLGTGQMSAVVAFNTVYAEAQHERTDFAHPKGGEAKYLERPLEANREQYERKIGEAVKRGLEK